MIRRVALLFAAAAAVSTLTACGSSGGSASRPAPSSGGAGSGTAGSSTAATSSGPQTVTVKNFEFTPGDITVKKGTKVTWKFQDSVNHNVTADNNSFKSKDLNSGGSYSYVFNTPGKYSYICTIHQYMKGSVTVQ